MIKEFIEYQRNGRQLSERTCTEYEKDLRAFATWAKGKGLRWSTIESRDIMQYQSEHSQLRGSTVNHRVTAVRQLYTWLKAQGVVNVNPCDTVSSVITHPRERLLLQNDDADPYLVEPVRSREELDAKLLYSLLLESGCRLSEVINLTVEDIDVDNMTFEVVGKGAKQRQCFYGKRTAYMMQQRINLGVGRLFEDYGERHFRYILAKYFSKYQPGIHPHALRHTFTTRYYEAGAPMQELAGLLGHSSARTTERYLHLSNDALMATHRRYVF